MSLETGPKHVRVPTGRQSWCENRQVISCSRCCIGIDHPNPWRSIIELVNEVVGFIPPHLAHGSGVTTVGSMCDKEPTYQHIRLTPHNESLCIFVANLEVLDLEELWFSPTVIADWLSEVDPKFHSILTSTVSSANS